MGSVDDPAIISRVNVGLSTELEAKVLDQVRSRAGKRLGHAAEIDDYGLDAVAFAFDLGLDAFHLVTIEVILDIAADVNESHDCGIELLIWLESLIW